MTSHVPQPQNTTQKGQIYAIGSVLGLAVGFVSAYLFARAADETDAKPNLESGDIVKISLALIALIRQMTELGSGKKN